MSQLLYFFEVLSEQVLIVHFLLSCALPELLILDLVLLRQTFLLPELSSFKLKHLCIFDSKYFKGLFIYKRTDPTRLGLVILLKLKHIVLALFSLCLVAFVLWLHHVNYCQQLNCEDTSSCLSNVWLVLNDLVSVSHVNESVPKDIEGHILSHLVLRL